MSERDEDLWLALPPGRPPWGWAWRQALLLGEARRGERALDLGCGEGAFTAALEASGVHTVGVDVAPEALRRARAAHPGLDFRACDESRRLPLEDRAVDLVWASEVIEHVDDVDRWLGEVRRVLSPGGRLLLTTPYHGRLQAAWLALTDFDGHFDPRGPHLRFFTASSLAALLADLGFSDVQVHARGGVPLARESLVARAVRSTWSSAGRRALCASRPPSSALGGSRR